MLIKAVKELVYAEEEDKLEELYSKMKQCQIANATHNFYLTWNHYGPEGKNGLTVIEEGYCFEETTQTTTRRRV